MTKLVPIFRRQAFKPSCPKGGKFHACQSGATKFVGCCNTEACSNGCSDGNLEPATFDPSYYGKFHDQQCPTGSRWYTCATTDSPFMGCCKSNACTGGCPVGDLTAGFLSSNPGEAADFLVPGAATTSSQASPTASKTTTPAAATTVAQSESHPSPEIIAGSSIGAVAALIIILASLVWLIRRKRSKTQQTPVSLSIAHESEKRHSQADVKHEAEVAPLSQYMGHPPTPELMSVSSPSYISIHAPSELDGANPMQKAVSISPQPPHGFSSPELSSISSDSPRQHQDWGHVPRGRSNEY